MVVLKNQFVMSIQPVAGADKESTNPRKGIPVNSFTLLRRSVTVIMTSFVFDDADWKDGYLRNNKSKTVKNMRCFPKCCDDGHTDKYFCGNAVRGALTVETHLKVQPDKLLIFGEFCPWEEIGTRIAEGQHVDSNQIAILVSTSQWYGVTSTNLYPMTSTSGTVVGVEFVSKSWSYLWVSDKWKRFEKHFFCVIVLAPEGSQLGLYVVLGRFFSRPFVLSCMRRNNSSTLLRDPRHRSNLSQDDRASSSADGGEEESSNGELLVLTSRRPLESRKRLKTKERSRVREEFPPQRTTSLPRSARRLQGIQLERLALTMCPIICASDDGRSNQSQETTTREAATPPRQSDVPVTLPPSRPKVTNFFVLQSLFSDSESV